MKNNYLYFLLLLFMQMGFSQNKLSWQGYFSYSEIKGISESENTVFAASENALFAKNVMTNLVKTTNTIDGLSGQTISAIYYSKTSNKTIVGYENGLITIINETDGKIQKVVDIITKQLPSEIKKINHFQAVEDLIYVSCDFGIVQFDLATMQFGDTYFIGDNGVEIKVKETTVFDTFIYAATNSGIRRAPVANKNLTDFNQWEIVATGSWSSISTFGNDLYAINTAGNIHKFNSVSKSFTGINQLPQATFDSRSSSGYFIVTTASSIYIYDAKMALKLKITSDQFLESIPSFTCATIIGDTIFIGTKENGMYSTSFSQPGVFLDIAPSGPSRNNIFSLLVTPTSFWAVYGYYAGDYNPYRPGTGPNLYGISKFDYNTWTNIPASKVLGARTLSSVAINPKNNDEVYVSSYFSGLLKIENNIPVVLYDKKNSPLEDITFIPNYSGDTRINGVVFDKTGNLWMNNSLIKNGLKVLNTNGQWQIYSTKDILGDPESSSLGRMIIDKYNTKWFCSNGDGIVGFNEKNSKFKKISFGSDKGNLPTNNTKAIAVDNGNQLWIGTSKGLRVLRNIGDFQSENQLNSDAIIILEENLPQELLYEQSVTDIAVDGANNKWIGTGDSGVFLVSPNGQETKYHFTVSNSPLPSNTINDIDINSITGEVFIATAKGMVSFKGVATSANSDLDNAYVYPNPVRPEYQGTVKIAGLLDKANVKITDIGGNLVYETTSQGGTIEWDTTAFGKYKVASGVYMIFISAQDGVETKVKKVMIIR